MGAMYTWIIWVNWYTYAWILTDPQYQLPQNAPDGNYCPLTALLGDVNGDLNVNIQDVILTVNIIIGASDFMQAADVNSDGAIDVLDIVLIVNIILYPN